MHVLAFDFDGVLCDSSREVFVVAVDTLANQEPGSELLSELASLRKEALAGGEEFRDHPLYRQFSDILPFGNRAEDFGVTLRSIEEGQRIGDQASYDDFYAGVGAPWRDEFHRGFYEARGRLYESNTERWLGLHLPYPDLVRALERHRTSVTPSVATAKDARSVRLLLAELGIDSFFDPQLILDKETGVHKIHHLKAVAERTGAAFNDITFIDDKVNHLVAVSQLGVRGVLAGWGFNTDREHTLARGLGFEVAHLDDLDQTVFKGE